MPRKLIGDDRYTIGNSDNRSEVFCERDSKLIIPQKKSENIKGRSRSSSSDLEVGIGSEVGSSKNVHKRAKISPENIHKKRTIYEGSTGWFRITLPFGNTYDKQFLKDIISERIAPLQLWPVAWETHGNISTFYIDDLKVADKLLSLNNTFEMPDGFKIKIKVNTGTPNVVITDTLKESMAQVMAKRYNPSNKALDLTSFHKDPMLEGYFCALSKPTVLLAVIEIIERHIPDLQALNLNGNKINKLMFLKRYNNKFKHVEILHLADNKIEDIKTLDALVGMPLIELLLTENPVQNAMRDRSVYEREIRDRFPNILKLDGVELTRSNVNLEEEQTLPSHIQTFLCNSDSGGVVRQFLEQYFLLFDTDNRHLLAQAYHENAIFSLTTSRPLEAEDGLDDCLGWYSSDDRNISGVTCPEKRFELLKKGNVEIITFFNRMPKSSHDIMKFTVDLTIHTPTMMCLTVTGMFKEVNSRYENLPIRAFSKTMVVVPAGSGYCIANEILHITNATEQQMQSFESEQPQPSHSQPIHPITQEHVLKMSVEKLLDSDKYGMVKALSKLSGMNHEWSTKCLQETEWNFERATVLFNEVNGRKGVPSEAFIE